MTESRFIRILCFAILAILLLPQSADAAKRAPVTEKIVFIPHDSRPISSKQTADVVHRVGYEIIVPPQELLGNREDWGHPDELWRWVDENIAQPGVKAAVISSDAMVYGSLVGSRKHSFSRSEVLARAQHFDELQRAHPKTPLYVFGSIMRTPRTGEASGHEEPEYYRRYGADIFRYTVLRDKDEVEGLTRRERKEYDFLGRLIPKEALADWMGRREKNYAVNEYLIDLLRKRNTFRYLTLGRDDNAPFSQTHLESRHLSAAGADLGKARFQTMAGIDEIALLMLTRAVNEQKHEIPFVFAQYNWGRGADTVPAYSDEKISTSISDAVLAAGGMMVRAPEKADVVLTVNTNPDGRTYEANAVLNDGTPRDGTMYFADLVADYVAKGYPVAIADIAFANGADNALMTELQKRGLLYKIQAYAGWNTPTNSSGFALGEGMLVRHMNGDSVDHLLTTRYLDDWAYQANVRNTIARQLTWLRGDGFYGSLGSKMDAVSMRSSRMMNRFIEENLPPIAEIDSVVVTFPWNRMFESDILPEDLGFAQEYLARRK
ncbi:hypothetical protein HMPREF9334_01919 [Selenomonas infelix ATCC 43532]|uniref:DUF4127 domain-containing protein n=1 Tax=Selenomonas infelix ATCC 43532 TaxID=679201 RepID=G5GRN8_9FIRM|nr:DUF4127 family protein [Selenomonas infelix]EHG18781.1 hypothetical protein HMPREF9334_01919 [Selenomonas infelix ATCC 43532]